MQSSEAKKLQKELKPLLEPLEKLARALFKTKKRVDDLASVTKGLYDELDKLCKKAPAERITDLALSQVNDALSEARELIPGDKYVQKLKPFVSAGENPEHRDAVFVLRQLLDAFHRFDSTNDSRLDWANKLAKESRTMAAGLGLAADSGQTPSWSEMRNALGEDPAIKFMDGYGGPLDLTAVKRIDIPTYFDCTPKNDDE